MTQPSVDDLIAFTLEHLESIELDGGGGSLPCYPEFDYYPYDYLSFAEENLREIDSLGEGSKKENLLISCLSNLKRSLDCQIECFLEAWGLRRLTRRRNLGIDAKLRFLASAGICNSRTIGRFISIRNRVEHDFQRPTIDDLEALFDLVTAIIALLYTVIVDISIFLDPDFNLRDEDGNCSGYMEFRYNMDECIFSVTWSLRDRSSPEGKHSIEVELDRPEEFAAVFRVWHTLVNIDGYASFDPIARKIRGEQLATPASALLKSISPSA